MASFHELNRTERAERSYPMYVRNNTAAWIAGIVIVLAAVMLSVGTASFWIVALG